MKLYFKNFSFYLTWNTQIWFLIPNWVHVIRSINMIFKFTKWRYQIALYQIGAGKQMISVCLTPCTRTRKQIHPKQLNFASLSFAGSSFLFSIFSSTKGKIEDLKKLEDIFPLWKNETIYIPYNPPIRRRLISKYWIPIPATTSLRTKVVSM